MSGSLLDELNEWCRQAEALVGLPVSGDNEGEIRGKLLAFGKIVADKQGEFPNTLDVWNDLKPKIEDAVNKNSLSLQDLSTGDNPVATLKELGQKLTRAKDLELRADKLALSPLGIGKLGSAATLDERILLIDDLERIKLAWATTLAETQKTAKEYFSKTLDIPKLQPELWKSANKKCPTPKGFAKLIEDGDARAAGEYVAQLGAWWIQTKTASAKDNWLRGEYGAGWYQQDPTERSELCFIAMQISVIQEQFNAAMDGCDENLADKERKRTREGKTNYEAKRDKFRLDFSRVIKEWQKPRVYLSEWIEAGNEAIKAIAPIADQAEDFADSDEFVTAPRTPAPVVVDVIWNTVVADCAQKWQTFCNTSNPFQRIAVRGVFPPANYYDHLAAKYPLGTRVRIGSRRYVVKESFTTKLAFHTEIPAGLLIPNRPEVRDFIYHFRPA